MSGIYIGAMGMMASNLKTEMHSHNIANSQTNGYKTDTATFRVFEETNQRKYDKQGTELLGKYQDMVYVDEIKTNFKAGNYVQSKQELDFSLMERLGETGAVSFFSIEKNGEELLTRNGSFKLNAERLLTTNLGGVVLDEGNQPITIPENVAFSVDKSGIIQNSETGEVIAQLKLRSVSREHLSMLEKLPEQTFRPMSVEKIENEFGPIEEWIEEFDNNVTLQRFFGSREQVEQMMTTGENPIVGEFQGELQQRMIESSNVDMTDEMAGLIESQKMLQSSQKVFKVMDEILEKDANEIAK